MNPYSDLPACITDEDGPLDLDFVRIQPITVLPWRVYWA